MRAARAPERHAAAVYLTQMRNAALEVAAAHYERDGAQRCLGLVDGFDLAIRYLNGLKHLND